MGRLAQHKYLLLLLVLVGMHFWSSFAHRAMLSPLVADVLVVLIVLAVFFVVFTRRHERAFALVTAVAAVAVNLSRHVFASVDAHVVQPAAFHVLLATFLAFAVYVILRDIFAERTVTRDEVVGTVCGYIIAAALWANLYALVEIFVPGSFTFPPGLAMDAAGWNGRVAVFNYFSIVTLTTMGYGDITPVHPPATALATLEAIFGQFYIAIVVAQLVGLKLAQAIAPKGPGK